jgi:hypothetical protein
MIIIFKKKWYNRVVPNLMISFWVVIVQRLQKFYHLVKLLIRSFLLGSFVIKTFELYIIEIILEEFQDHFGQALNLSIKQMTQHLLSNINLFYNHYQYEFEQLTKKYRLTFLQRFVQLMKKYQYSNNIIYKTKPSISGRVI